MQFALKLVDNNPPHTARQRKPASSPVYFCVALHQVVVVSHDAAFLDAVATDVLLLAHGPRQLEAFRGRYSAFKAQRPEIHAYLTRRTDLRGNNVLAAGDKFTLTFPR